MKLNPEQKALLRQGLLLQLEAASPVSLPITTLAQGVRLAGFADRLDTEVRADLDYLVDKGLAIESTNEISAGLKRWKLTAEGREFLEGKGLV